MNPISLLRLSVLAAVATAPALAQGPDFLLTFSQPESTLSGSAGTVLRNLNPNEVAELNFTSVPCTLVSAEKFVPRTCFDVMAGDENADGVYWNPSLFGRIDAMCQSMGTAAGTAGTNPREMFWSPSVAMGTNVSGLPLRPGDVGRIINLPTDGQVQYFMRQEQFNISLGLPPATPIDVDAIAWSPNYGVFFSLDTDIAATTVCGPTFVRDGDVICVPAWAITWTPDMRVGAVMPNSAVVVYNEAQMDAFTVAANVTNRFGMCVPNVIDVEGLEIDWMAPPSTITGICGVVVPVPSLIYTAETLTGGAVLTTAFGGQIYNSTCAPLGTSCGFGPTLGNQVGIQPPTAAMGVPSYVNAICAARVCRYALEPVQHVLAYGGLGGPGTNVDVASPWLWNFVFIELAPPVVPISLTVSPFFSLLCFPDLYTPSLSLWAIPPAPGGFGTFATPAIPPLWTGKLLFQSLAFGGSGLELSTPAVIDVQ
ncbi:MAG: hypothetical protein K8J09_03595 [Planctomycetes bacterium]|nr:hypothetical protein [Planctomycetota bacterium]MCC7395989.1 hypothetical protein [Planctomycetota bacterium]